jgi:hypothetical protein
MVNEPKTLFARPVFRWLAGFSCLVCLVIGVTWLFPGIGLTDEPGYFLAAVFLFGAFVFGRIAATGRLERTPSNQ